MKKRKMFKTALTASLVVSLAAGMVSSVSADTSAGGADALAQLYATFSTGINEDGSADLSAYDYAEGQLTDGLNGNSGYASAFDLRHVGGQVTYNSETKKNDITGGTSYVTSVKLQNPWGTCWAFGITAASEISILYELGLGTGTADNDSIDLSEHHLAWFAKNHIPAEGEEGYGTNDVSGQDGEGMWYTAGLASSNMNGGNPYLGTSVFAAGSGIVTEDFAPYIGQNGMVMVRRITGADLSLYPDRYLYYDSVEEWEAETDEGIKANYNIFCYSGKDDWSLDESMRFCQSAALEESCILPDASPTKDASTGAAVLNTDGINAIKKQLTEGRGVEVSYYADNADPTLDVTLNTSRYINSNYAHYTWDKTDSNHSVCIVGWDDDYDASNFGQEHPVKYDASGRALYKLKDSDQELTYSKDEESLYYVDGEGVTHTYELTSDDIEPVREEDGSASVPSGNGAWIVKNSWGAVDNEFPNKHTWGADGSGYFYLSYYDTSVQKLETYDFVVTEEEKSDYDYSIISEYDFMTAHSTGQATSTVPMMMANVFTADEDMEIDAVSCQTTTPGTKVIYGICLLDDDGNLPSDESGIKYTDPVTYEFGGYHRLELSESVLVPAGRKYAVIVCESYTAETDGQTSTSYYLASNTSVGQAASATLGIAYYCVGIVNPGESYIITSGAEDKLEWTDYSSYLAYIEQTNPQAALLTYDNFSIKAYGRPAELGERTVGKNGEIHYFTYSASDSALTATCAVTDCSLPDHKVSLNLSASSPEYTGSAYAGAVLTDNAGNPVSDTGNNAWIQAGLAVPDLTYEGRGETGYAVSSTAPSGAGSYKVTASVGGSAVSVDFDILKAAGPSAPDAALFTVSTPERADSADGCIFGADETMEYSTDGGYTWIPVSGNMITGLSTGNVLIRYAETVNVKAGEAMAVTVPIDKESQEAAGYAITEGAGSVWTLGSDRNLTFRGNGKFEKFVSVKVDGSYLTENCCSAASGSTVINLKSAYLNTLTVGQHHMEIVWTNGSAGADFTITENRESKSESIAESGTSKADPTAAPQQKVSPGTGDTNTPLLWILLMAAAAAGIVICLVVIRRKKSND